LPPAGGQDNLLFVEKPMSEPVAYLKALTPEGKAALGGSLLEIPRFPFRVGRESRKAGKPMEGGISRTAGRIRCPATISTWRRPAPS